MENRLDEFTQNRKRMISRISELHHKGINRLYNLDPSAYENNALNRKPKELLGLVASMVLRCNDCINYQIIQCGDAGWTDQELTDAFNVALVVGGVS